jgi:hypothetical protein
MTLTKDQLISSIGNRLGISRFESSRIVESDWKPSRVLSQTVRMFLSAGLGNSLLRKRHPGEEETLRPGRI